MRISLFGLSVSFLVGCAVTAPDPMESSSQSVSTPPALPTITGSFQGHYVVPTTPDLATAAVFAVPDADWTVAGGTATLHYELPVGLVGGVLPVTLSGPIPAGATSVQLTSANGAGSCTASGTVVTCSESFSSLGALPISMAVVQQTAAAEFPGPAASRVAVANIFSSDPIGTVSFDVALPSDEDGGGGGGGHGGGGHGGGGGGGGGRH